MLIPELSPTAGANADGVVLGTVGESLMMAVMQTVERCDSGTLQVCAVDYATGSARIRDITADAISGVTNQCKPFGDGTTFSNNDCFLIACPDDVQAIMWDADTAAAHTGSLKVYDSTDGMWASNELAVTDDGNAYRATGWHYLTLPDNASRQVWKPSNDPALNMASMKYFLVKLTGIGAGATPPSLSELFLIRKTFVYNDHTAAANGATATAPLAHKHYPWPGSTLLWCTSNPAYRYEVYMHLVQTNVITDEHEILTGAGWVSASDWNNQTNDFTTGPAVLGNPVQKLPITHAIQSAWATLPQTFELEDGSTVTYTGYWIRERTIGVTQYGEHQNPRYRLRARQYGNTNTSGGTVLVAKTLRGVTLHSLAAADTPAVDTLARAVNLSTGAESSTFTISAADIALLLQGVSRTFDFADLSFAAGDREPAYRCVSGGALRNVDLQEIYS